MFPEFLYWLIPGFFVFMTMIIAGIALTFRHQNIHKKREMLQHFDGYVAVLQYHMDRAYEIIHKDQILIYSLEATGISNEQFNSASQSFCRLTIKLLGDMIYNELKYMYGGEITLFINMTEFFNTKYEDDEIRSSAIENLISDEED
jgi:hypothetical protein